VTDDVQAPCGIVGVSVMPSEAQFQFGPSDVVPGDGDLLLFCNSGSDGIEDLGRRGRVRELYQRLDSACLFRLAACLS